MAINEPITFVVESRNGVDCPSVIWGKLPERLTRKSEPKLLRAAVRLDQRANVNLLLQLSVGQLYALYKAGEL